jgi:AcrR family transcriptional regulator
VRRAFTKEIGVGRAGAAFGGGARSEGAELRILDGAARAVSEFGYSELTVEKVLAIANLSRGTFYQYFTSLEECFLASYDYHAAELIDSVSRAARGTPRPERAALTALLEWVRRRPHLLTLLAVEPLAAGPAGIYRRERLIAALTGAVEARTGRTLLVDLPPPVLIGGVLTYLGLTGLGSPGGDLPDVVLPWVCAFDRRPEETSWAAELTPASLGATFQRPAAYVSTTPTGAARERMILATMLAVRERGVQNLTVADIVRQARSSRRRFYSEFGSRQDALIAAYERGFQRTIAACAPAFFSASSWPERVWDVAHAFTGFLASEPLLCHLGFVESFAIGRDYLPRLRDTQLAFTLFLEEGFRESGRAELLPRASAALTVATIFELALQASRLGPGEHLRRSQPLAVYIALAPFLGRERAGEFVAGKLAQRGGCERRAASCSSMNSIARA